MALSALNRRIPALLSHRDQIFSNPRALCAALRANCNSAYSIPRRSTLTLSPLGKGSTSGASAGVAEVTPTAMRLAGLAVTQQPARRCARAFAIFKSHLAIHHDPAIPFRFLDSSPLVGWQIVDDF